jgi:hypothetical protein
MVNKRNIDFYMNLYDKQKHMPLDIKPLCFKRINLEKIKVFDFVCNNGGGGGLLKEDGLI